MLSVSDGTECRREVTERAIGRSLLVPSIGAIMLATLVPSDGAAGAAQALVACLVCGDTGAVDVAHNTMLFLPFGLALGLMRIPWQRVVLTALLMTVTIELLQLTLIPGRDASLSDLLTNTGGAALGTWFARHWRRVLVPDRQTARALVSALTLGWVLARLSTAWLVRPSFPDTRWYGQVAPVDVYPATFGGAVLRGELGSVSARSGEMPELPAAFRTPEIVIRALVTGAQPSRGLASVLSVLDEHRSEVLLLGQERNAARLRFRLRTADLRLRTPSVRLDGALAYVAGEATELVGHLRPGTLSLSSRSAARSTATTLVLGPGLGWALLLPFDVGLTPAAAAAGTAACTAAVVFMIAFLASRSRPDRRSTAVGATVVAAAIGLWLPLIFFPEATVAATEVLAAVVGAFLGTMLGAGRRPLS